MDELKKQLLETIKDFINERFKSLEAEVSSLRLENQSLKDGLKNLSTKAVNGKDGMPGKDGQDGIDGKDFDQAIAQNMLDLMFKPYEMKLQSIKDGKDGRDGKDGENGKDGRDGKDGDSAYDIAVKYGFKGTQLEFAQKQFGQDGKAGENGKDGKDGQDGLSAYDIAVKCGFKGTQLEFAQKQIGADGRDGRDGRDGKDGIDGIGFDDLKAEFDGERTVTLQFSAEGRNKAYKFEIPAQIYKGVYKEGQKYSVGDTVTDNGSLWSCLKANDERPISATSGLWQLAVKHGSKGEKGIPGVSAYELAVNNGFKGSEKEYLASIRRGINS